MTTAAGKCFLDMLGVFAEFETNLRKERQTEGIARGRKPVISPDAIRQRHSAGHEANRDRHSARHQHPLRLPHPR
jgi:DNA invertase Pin-like site-specific DNA recombinase